MRMKNKLKTAVALLLCAVLCLPMAGCGKVDRYKEAISLSESGDYEAAKQAFIELGDYRDSAEKARECAYSQASAAYQAGDYDAAGDLFSELGYYKDSYKRGVMCRLQSDSDAYVDSFAQYADTFFSLQKLDLALAEDESLDYGDGHRTFRVVSGDGGTDSEPPFSVYIAFSRTDSGMSIHNDGQVNAVTTYGVYSDGSGGDVHAAVEAFIAGSMASFGEFAGGGDLEQAETQLRSKMSQAVGQLSEQHPVIYSEWEYNGFYICDTVSADGDMLMFTEMIVIPDLMEAEQAD